MQTFQLLAYRRAEGGEATAIIGEPGRKFTKAVWIDAPVRLRKVPNDVMRGASRTVPYTFPKPLVRAARNMLRAGKRLGITQSAQSFLYDVIREGNKK